MHEDDRNNFIARIFSLSTEHEFEAAAMELFTIQSRQNSVYRKYLELTGSARRKINRITDIPCLPVSFFKTHRIVTGEKESRIIFRSSGTGGVATSRHHIHDPELYKTSFLNSFEMFYGPASKYCILALLPSYLEREDSSLVYMVRHLIEASSHPDSGFYLDDTGKLAARLKRLEAEQADVLLLGVSFALLDLVENHTLPLRKTIMIETGGMKGRRKELTREELHLELSLKTGLKNIHSEYGMTELLSQAWSMAEGRFSPPPWMKVMIRDSYDPFTYIAGNRSGGVNIIDLANIDSCAFIETSDLGRLLPGGEFEILGRFDHSDIRGCNLLAE
jgi:phenylacetate-coenzyme A ligase PaaK-like adenylate-forming protein